MRRLYVGGLSHTVTEKDLKDRFGKFGAVEDVELRTRRDPEGVPLKTFGYVNINILDADLKKCLTVLNKSKWKGGTLQIEIAKESFLHRCKVLHVTEQTDVKDSSKAQKKEVTPRINTIGVNSMQEATKLAQERQEAAEQHLRQPAAEDKRQKLLDSLSKSGVDNFTMKAAVPGTEIPGHKDWVVSKFGRVLPILQLRKGNKSRTLKYDPSKYSHNIRKLDRDAKPDEFTPITQLTWEVQGGDDDISKKRRGEFPPSEPWRPKKSRTDDASGRTRFEHPVNCVSYSEAHRLSNGFEKQNNHRPAQRKWTHFSDSDVDSDEEIRRLVAAQQSSRFTPQQQQQQEVEEETLEVVGYDFLSKSSRKGDQEDDDDDDDDDYDSADTDELFASRKPPPPECQEKHAPPTVEHLSGNNMDTKRKAKKSKAGEREEEDGSTDDEEHLTSRKPSSVQQKEDSEQKLNKKTAVVKPSLSQSDSDEDDENEVDSADSCSDSDYEAMFSNVTHLEISLADLQKLAEEAQQNSRTTAPSILGAKLEQKRTLTSGPAEQSAPKKGTTPEEILAAIMEDDSSEDEQKKKKTKRKAVMSAPLPAFQGTKAISEVSETDEHKKGQEEEEEEEDGRGREVKKQRMNSDAPQLIHKATDGKTSTSVRDQKHAEAKISDSSGQEEDDEEEDEEDDNEEHESDDVEEEEDMAAPDVFKMIQNRVCVIPEKAEIESSSSNDDEEEEEEERVNASQTVVKAKSSSSPSSCSSSGDDENEQQIICAEGPVEAALSSETSTSEEEEEEEERPPPRMALGVEEEEERQRQANMRRLAAVQQRQKEAEEHKRLIQGALASLDAPAAGAGKHIVFGSDDDEDDGDDKGRMVPEVSTSKKTLFQDSQSEDEADGDEAAANGGAKVKEKMRLKSSGPQLFGSSDDEDDDAEKEEDGSRFDIKPQFEGQAGQKLMALQSRFGTDERFRMDSRFLEEDEEDKEEESRETADAETKNTLVEDDEDLEEEKKKNLSILQSVLGQQQCSSKTAGKAKKFRDVSALHYDPSKEEHAAFETKKDEIKKESKAARKKKREEAQKLPEVPKEIYYDVSGDLKVVFGQSKHETAEQEEKTNWDQMEEEEGTEKEEEFAPLASVLSAPGAENEDSSGFKFSFFGDDTEAESKETAEYKVEAIQAPKVSWQQDPRFHDSSSEEEEDEQEEDEEQSSAAAKTTEAVTPSHTEFFFFCTDDDRLTEGPKLFCRVSELEEQREHWEERRSALRQEYRKKHRDAKRKLTSSSKS